MSNLKTIAEAADEIIKYIDDKRSGKIKDLKTRWKKLNKSLPIEWHTLYTIAGISGSGKSSFANELETSLFDNNPDEDFAVLSFNYEMMSSRQVGRKISFFTQRTISELYSKNENILDDTAFKYAKEAAEHVKRYDITYVDTPYSVAEMRSIIVNYIEKIKKPLMIFIDHSRLVKRSGKSEAEMLTELTDMCIELKKKYKCSFFVLSQLNREIEKPERTQNPQGHFPQRGDLFGSDSVYQGSDYVIIIHRPELLGIPAYGMTREPTKDAVFIHILKNRDGDTKVLRFINVLKYNRLDEN